MKLSKFFFKPSIKFKLISIILSVSFLALFLFTAAQIILGSYYIKEKALKDLVITSKILGHHTTSSLEFFDAQTAKETLSTLKENKEVLVACLYTNDNILFANYTAQNHHCPQSKAHTPKLSFLEIGTWQNIQFGEKTIGQIYLKSSLKSSFEYFIQFCLMLLVVFVLAILIALKLSIKAQKVITEPLISLTNVVKKVSKSEDYSLRAPSQTNDEIHYLVDGFNNMLSVIEKKHTLLEESKKTAEYSNKIKTEFLSNMSHEIRTPLNGVIATAELLMQTKLNKEQESLASIIEKSGKTLLSIINDILDISKIESGKISLENAPFNLTDVVQRVLITIKAGAHQKGIEIYSYTQPHVETIAIGDEMRLRQVLTNLVSNAIKFTSKGEVSISLDMQKETNKNIYKITVKDTGIGIDSEKLESIFNRFSQEDGSITRRYGGTGLGLSICKELAELMGGKIIVESKKNAGSSFTLELPMQPATLKEGNVTKLNIQNIHKPSKILNILIAEDDLVNQKIIEKMMSLGGHKVTLANNGLEAFQKVQEKSFDLILMDMQMPVLDGIEATQKIRAFEKEVGAKPTRILALTANALEEHKKLCYEVGMDGYYTKPITLKSIQQMLEF